MTQRRDFIPREVGNVYPILGALVVPRPIAWVSSTSPQGVDNLAPHSFFQIVSTSPPIVMFSSMGEKDTTRNVRQSREFVVCGTPASLIDRVNLTGVEFPSDVSEFDELALVREPSKLVAPPRVRDSPYALECTLVEITTRGNGVLVFGEVQLIAIAEDVLVADRVNNVKLDLVSRLGGNEWGHNGPVTELARVPLSKYRRDNPPITGK
jgi:flavin reductase (DIM6/NTAB) family NADH-FMN oxidoreductase RutF